MKQGSTPQEITTYFLKTYAVDESTFEKDLYDFINMLSKFKLAENNEKEKN